MTYSHKWIPYDKLVNNAVKIGRTILTAWIKQVPDLLFSYLHLTLSSFCSCVLITCQPDD